MSIKDIELFREGKIDYSKQEVANVLRDTVAKGLTDNEYIAFGTLCAATGLNPIRKEIWAIKLPNGSLQIMTGLNGYRAIANSHPSYDGMEGPVFHYDANGNLLSAEVFVFRKDRSRPHKGYAIWSESHGDLKSKYGNDTIWAKRPHQMLAKCAECDGLRRAFPQEMGGLYAEEEMPSEFAKPSDNGFTPAKIVQPTPLPEPTVPQVDKMRVKKLCDALKSELGFKAADISTFINETLGSPVKSTELTEEQLEKLELTLLDRIDAKEAARDRIGEKLAAIAAESPEFVDTIGEPQSLGFNIPEKEKSYHFED
jgi:phage recombination protein Bet